MKKFLCGLGGKEKDRKEQNVDDISACEQGRPVNRPIKDVKREHFKFKTARQDREYKPYNLSGTKHKKRDEHLPMIHKSSTVGSNVKGSVCVSEHTSENVSKATIRKSPQTTTNQIRNDSFRTETSSGLAKFQQTCIVDIENTYSHKQILKGSDDLKTQQLIDPLKREQNFEFLNSENLRMKKDMDRLKAELVHVAGKNTHLEKENRELQDYKIAFSDCDQKRKGEISKLAVLLKDLQSQETPPVLQHETETELVVESLLQTAYKLVKKNNEYSTDIQYLSSELDRSKRECERWKKTARRMTDSTDKQTTLKCFDIKYNILMEENARLKKNYSSERPSMIDSSELTQLRSEVQKKEMQLNEKTTEITSLRAECERESAKAQRLLHDRDNLKLELMTERSKYSCVLEKNDKLQQTRNALLHMQDAGTLEADGDLNQSFSTWVAQTCRRPVDRMSFDDDTQEGETLNLRENEANSKSQVKNLSENTAVFKKYQEKYAAEIEKVRSVTSERDSIRRALESERRKVKSVTDEKNMLQEELTKIKLENTARNKTIEELSSRCQRLEQDYKDLGETTSLQMQERDEKLKQSSLRISKLVAENVLRSNPCLEDLSSQNRSMKIAERFRGDLYGDAWCDALDSLMDNDLHEEDALKTICDTLVAVYEFCRNHCARVVQYASSTLVNLSDAGLDSPLMGTQETGGSLEHLHSAMKDYLRASAMSVTPDKLLQLYNSTGGADTSPLSVALLEFTRLALAICWCMATQDPPMSLAYKLTPGDAFDPSSFQTYCSSGNRAKFLVWPALLLTDSGPLMEKGVVYT